MPKSFSFLFFWRFFIKTASGPVILMAHRLKENHYSDKRFCSNSVRNLLVVFESLGRASFFPTVQKHREKVFSRFFFATTWKTFPTPGSATVGLRLFDHRERFSRWFFGLLTALWPSENVIFIVVCCTIRRYIHDPCGEV